MPQNPKFSVIIPTCGRPDLLMACVASVLKNDMKDFELLVIDQDPQQTLRTQLRNQFPDDSRIRYLFLECAGASRARNTGIRHAQGTFIAFVDDDLEVGSDWLRAYETAFESITPMPGIIGGQVDPIWLSPRPSWFPKEREYLLGLYHKGDELIPMKHPDLPFTANCAVPRSIIDKVGMLDERIGFSYSRKNSMLAGEDSLMALKIRQADYSIYYQPRAMARHKIAKNKLTRRYFLKRQFWEGMTTIVVMYLSNTIGPKNCPDIIRAHFKTIGKRIRQAIYPKKNEAETSTNRRAPMSLFPDLAYSLGVLCASTQLFLKRKLL